MLNIHRIIYLYETEGYKASADAAKAREKHVMYLNQCLRIQAKETKRREYVLQQQNAFGKVLFYAYLLGSKSELTTQSYFVNGSWAWF